MVGWYGLVVDIIMAINWCKHKTKSVYCLLFSKYFISVLRKLLSHKVDITIFDHDGRQPLMWAASAGMYFFQNISIFMSSSSIGSSTLICDFMSRKWKDYLDFKRFFEISHIFLQNGDYKFVVLHYYLCLCM